MSKYAYFRKQKYLEACLLQEGLSGIQGLGDRASSILSNAVCMIKSKNNISEASTPKMIARHKDIIECSSQLIKNNLKKLGADDACVAQVLLYIDCGDIEKVKLQVLRLLVKRNPGLYSHQLAMYEVQMKQR